MGKRAAQSGGGAAQGGGGRSAKAGKGASVEAAGLRDTREPAGRRTGGARGTGALAGTSAEEGSSEEEEEVEEEEDATPTCVWTLKGALAGRVATDKARKNEDYDVDPPAAVMEAGDRAELAWLTAFFKAYKAPAAPQAHADRRVAGLTAPKRRRVSSKPEPNKTGRAGLDESAEPLVSAGVYAFVRDEFFLPADHLSAHLRACLLNYGFECTEAEVDAWWEEKGHTLTLTKAKSARHSIVDSVKSGIWLAHGALGVAVCASPRAHPRRPQLARRSRPRLRSTSPARSASATTRRWLLAQPQPPSSRRGAPPRRTCRRRGARPAAAEAASSAKPSGSQR